ncbi:hypothetical protein D3C84_732510 [compost metagenome]
MAKVRAVDGNTPTTQPAHQADHQHQKSFFAKTRNIIVFRAAIQADDCTFAAHRQRAAKIAKEQGKVVQALAHGFVQVWFLNQGPANQGEAARRHAVGVEPEELVIELADLDQPECGKRTGRHPRHGLFDQHRVDTCLFQRSPPPLRIVPQPMDHRLHKVGGHRILFPHLNASLPITRMAKNTSTVEQFRHRTTAPPVLDSRPIVRLRPLWRPRYRGV